MWSGSKKIFIKSVCLLIIHVMEVVQLKCLSHHSKYAEKRKDQINFILCSTNCLDDL